MDEQLNIFDKIGNIISIVAGILFLIASLFPWIGMILKAVSIQGVNVLDAKGYSKNLFQYGVNNVLRSSFNYIFIISYARKKTY